MNRYLIAGAAGYVGSRLAEALLAQGHSVRGVVRHPEDEVVQRLAGLGMAVWQGDLTQPDSLVGVATGAEVVYNLTSCSVLEPDAAHRLFVDGNRNLIAACSRARTVRAYLFTGSAAVYGDQGERWLSEDTPPAPCFPLGQVLTQAEQAIVAMVRTYRFPAILLRVGTVYGPGRDLVDTVQSGTAPLLGDGRNFLSYMHITDLLAALQRLAHAGQPGAIYNVCDDEPVRAAELYTEICQRLGILPPQPFAKASALAAGLDASVVGIASASARMSNQRLKHDLAMPMHYPSVYDWLDERLVAGEPVPVLARRRG